MRTRTTTKRRGALLISAAALAALLGGNAFTASNTFAADATAPLTGYASTTVTGGTINQLAYNLNAAGDNVNTVTLVLNGDTIDSAVSVGFNGGATTSCGTGDNTTTPGETAYTCDNGGANFVQSTSGLTATAVVIN